MQPVYLTLGQLLSNEHCHLEVRQLWNDHLDCKGRSASQSTIQPSAILADVRGQMVSKASGRGRPNLGNRLYFMALLNIRYIKH